MWTIFTSILSIFTGSSSSSSSIITWIRTILIVGMVVTIGIGYYKYVQLDKAYVEQKHISDQIARDLEESIGQVAALKSSAVLKEKEQSSVSDLLAACYAKNQQTQNELIEIERIMSLTYKENTHVNTESTTTTRIESAERENTISVLPEVVNETVNEAGINFVNDKLLNLK